MSRRSFPAQALSFGLLSLALGACQAVAGIEDRKLDPKLLPRVDSQQCKDYCSVVMDACSDDDAVYANLGQCLSVCATLDPGDPEEIHEENTVACRAREAENAKDEPKGYCRSAGPGGNGKCGTDCEAYCQIFPQICPKQYEYGSSEECLRACGALTEQDRYNLEDDHGGDTIECRLVHTSSASVDPTGHCAHAPVRPSDPWCVGDPKEPPTCQQYCDIELAACQDTELAQYESPEQCLAVCAALPPGVNPDQAANTMACRRYHSFNSITSPAVHCFHSGPTGDGHCGDSRKAEDGFTTNCESYCELLAKACPTEFDDELGSAEGCMEACVQLPEADPESHYTVESASKSSGLNCRVLYTTRAFADSAACESAMGRDNCQ
jgi:hypothetical protein